MLLQAVNFTGYRLIRRTLNITAFHLLKQWLVQSTVPIDLLQCIGLHNVYYLIIIITDSLINL